MHILKKFLIWFAIVLVSLIVLAFVAASVYINQFKPHLEKALTENIGLQTKIDGKISLKVIPGLSFVATKIKVISNETYVLRVAKTEISIDLAKLFSGEIKIIALHFVEPQVYVVRNTSGIYNFEKLYAQANKTAEKAAERLEIDLEEFSVTDGSILYFDLAHGDTLRVEGIDLFSDDLGFTGTLDNIKVKQLRFNGLINIRKLSINKLAIDTLSFAINGRGGEVQNNR